MNPTESITREAKSKDGKNIIITIDTYKDAIVKSESESFHTLLTLTDRKTKALIGRLPFPKATKDLLEQQMDITVKNINQYLDVISKG